MGLLGKVKKLQKLKSEIDQARREFHYGDQYPPENLVPGVVHIPEKVKAIFDGPARYRCAYGGRGSGKSRSFALMAALRGYRDRIRILCAREFQNSIEQSVFKEIEAAINAYPWLKAHYEVGRSYIRGRNGTEFLFKGLHLNSTEIKSTSDISICWVEEAEVVSKKSLDDLIPTIRKDGSEIWFTWNPESEDSAVRTRFIVGNPTGLKIAEVNYVDNPWFPKTLELERQDCQRLNPDDYAHIWLGEIITRSDAQILNKKWRVEEFTPGPDWDGPYYGADWGFGMDPTVAIRVWLYQNKLYVEYESGEVGLELDDTGRKWVEDIPGIADHVVRADCSRPESISHVKRGRPQSQNDLGATPIPQLMPCEKWSGSVQDGIAFLRSHEAIIIHPRCPETAFEARKYSYKVDRRTGDVVSSIIVDKYNHRIDSIRYACGPMIKGQDFYTPGTMVGIIETSKPKIDQFGRAYGKKQ